MVSVPWVMTTPSIALDSGASTLCHRCEQLDIQVETRCLDYLLYPDLGVRFELRNGRDEVLPAFTRRRAALP